MAIFAPKPWVNPFERMSMFRLFEHLVFIVQTEAFSFLNIVKDISLAFNAYKKKFKKITSFRPKPWVKHLGKMSIFRYILLLVFIAQKGFFSFQNILKDIFMAYITQKKKVGKMAIFRPNPWINPFAKISIFRFFEHLVF